MEAIWTSPWGGQQKRNSQRCEGEMKPMASSISFQRLDTVHLIFWTMSS